MGPGIIAAAVTTIGTFLLLLASDYRGLGELGAVCGLGLAVALVQVLLVVPAALTLAGPEHEPAPLGGVVLLAGKSFIHARPWAC